MLREADRAVSLCVKRTALDRVLSSRTFLRCDQLKSFLSYVCEKEFAGKAQEISEYGIGIDALGRPKNFSPQGDSTVRSRAYSLRQKLNEYYEQESPEAPVRIVLPKGSYVPQFEPASESVAGLAAAAPAVVAPPSPETCEPPSVSPSPGPKERSRGWLLPFASGVAIASILWLAVIAFPRAARSKIDPVIAEAWGPLLAPDANVSVCLSNPPHLHVRAYPKGTAEAPYSNPPLLPATPEAVAFFESFRLFPPGSPVYMWRTNNSALIGDVLAATAAIKTLNEAGTTYELLPEKMVGVLALRGRNVIRVGSPLDSAGVAFELSRARLSIRYDPAFGDDVIADKPAGAPGVRTYTYFRRNHEVLGLLTVMPAEKGRRNRRLVVVSGVASGGTHAAMEFFRSPEEMNGLKKRFAAEGISGFPTAYQVVVRGRTENSIQMGFEYLSHIVLER